MEFTWSFTSMEENFRHSFDYRHVSDYSKCIKNVSVKCLQSIQDLKKLCDKLGILFVDYSKFVQVDLILDDKIVANQTFYLVKWRGRSNKYNSWVSASRLTDCEDLLFYYSSLKRPPALLSEEMFFYFVKDLVTRKPYDILTSIKFYALISRFDEEYVKGLGLTFSDLKRKILKVSYNSEMINEMSNALIDLMISSENRKIILSRIKDWETKINSISPVYVKVENNVDLFLPPEDFQFINDYISSDIDLTEKPVVFCSCIECENSNDCCPHNSEGKFAYNKQQRLQLPTGHPIYECNRLCKCDNNCTNRVVQHGPKVKVAIFRTNNGCGWGLKTLETVQKGQFVLEYLGEILTSEHAEKRGEVYVHLGRTYLFDMGFDDGVFYTIDAMLYGNASHFINHSCDPNLATYSVWINQQDPKLPRIALFAKKKINPGEELTFDYKIMNATHDSGENILDIKQILCKCNSKNCRKFF